MLVELSEQELSIIRNFRNQKSLESKFNDENLLHSEINNLISSYKTNLEILQKFHKSCYSSKLFRQLVQSDLVKLTALIDFLNKSSKEKFYYFDLELQQLSFKEI